jgi:magnesium transporter
MKGGFEEISESTQLFMKDLYDHIIQVYETTESYRDTLSGFMDIHLSSSSNKMNRVMKVLTIISTIFIPLTFIVGVYGMNFHYMPELEWKHGYFLIWAIMVAILIGMLYYFKKKKWL